MAMLFVAILIRDFRQRNLFHMVRDMTILNMTMWFLLGFFTFIQQLFVHLQSIFVYILLAPYAIISGYLVFYLLSNTGENKETIVRGAVAISTMIAVVSAVNGAILTAFRIMSQTVASSNLGELTGIYVLVERFSWQGHNPHLAFLILLVIFNIPFFTYYIRASKKPYTALYWYAVPILTYVLLQGAWQLVRSVIPALA